MNGLQKKVLKRVSGAHISVLFLILFIPWIKGCFHPKPKEIITFINLAAPAPSVLETAAEPEPVPAVIPKPEPKPEPKPKPIPKPVITNTPPKVVKPETKPKPPPKKTEPKPVTKKPEPKPTPKPETKPAPKKTEAERLAAIRQNNPVTKAETKPAPKLDLSGLKSALNSAAQGSATGSGAGTGGGVYSPFAGYYDSIKQRMYAVWRQPSGAPSGLAAEATIRVESDGAVSSKFITRRSGNAVFDQSVQNALNATTRLPAPPADLPSRTISIEFVLSN